MVLLAASIMNGSINRSLAGNRSNRALTALDGFSHFMCKGEKMRKNGVFCAFAFALAISGVVFPIVFPASIYGRCSRVPQARDRQVRKANIVFEENLGQFDPQVIFAGKGNRQTVFLTADEATFVLPIPETNTETDMQTRGPRDSREERAEERSVYALKMKFAGANSGPETVFEGELEGKLGYFKGNDPSKWVPEVPRYSRVTSRNAYKGIDITWYENDNGGMEYDLIVAPGADPGQVLLDFDGADLISVNASGDLEIETPAGPMYQKKPVVFQDYGGLKAPVESGYIVSGSRVSFAVGDYDRSKTLVIDPLPPLYYSTYLGGNDSDVGSSIKADQFGNAYITGYSYSPDYPITSGTNPVDKDVLVTKLNSYGTALYYSFLIGGSGGERGESIAINGSGEVFVTGTTASTNFPISWIAYDSSYNGGQSDNFIFKLNANGSINYSTYIGGNDIDEAFAIAIDSEGSAYITGITESSNYPTTGGAYDQTLTGTQDVFVTKINSGGYALAYSTYLGGSGFTETSTSLAVDSLGRAYVAGMTLKQYFPVTPGSYSTSNATTLTDCFVTKFNSAGSALVYSTVFGGDAEESVRSIAIDSSGNAYITGHTGSSNYPKTLWAYDTVFNSESAAFVTEVNSGGASLGYSTFLEGNDGITAGNSIVVDNSGNVTLVGGTWSASFPVGPNAFDLTYNGGQYDDALGLAVSNTGFAYIVGRTTSNNYPTTAGVWDTTYSGSYDAFVTRYEAGYLP